MTQMFLANNAALLQHKFDPKWITASTPDFEAKVSRWLKTLGAFIGGPSRQTRQALTAEFMATMLVYDLMLKLYRTEQRENRSGDANSLMALTMSINEVDQRMNKYQSLHTAEFGGKVVLGPNYQNLQNVVQELHKRIAATQLKCDIIDRKIQLVQYWLKGAVSFEQELIPNVGLQLQFLANSQPAQVSLILEILTRDAAKLLRLHDPTSAFSVKSGFDASASGSVEWSEEDFRLAVRAEAGVSYAVEARGEGSWEISGLKAKVEASAWAGVRANAQFEATADQNGISASGKVEAEIGIRLKFKAETEVLDVFSASVGADAFAGAMARGEFEITATRQDGVKVKLEGEAFAGLYVEGTANFEWKFQGLTVMKGGAKGRLSLGVGVAGKLDFEVSPMGSCSFALGADMTVGAGIGGEVEFEFEPNSMAMATNALFYTTYLAMLGGPREAHAYQTYFRDIEYNAEHLRTALDYLRDCQRIAYTAHDAAVESNELLSVLDDVIRDRFKPTGMLPPIRPKALTLEPKQTYEVPPPVTRGRRNAITQAPPPLVRQNARRF